MGWDTSSKISRAFESLLPEHIPHLKQYMSYSSHVFSTLSLHPYRSFYKYNQSVFNTLSRDQKIAATLLMHYLLYILLSQKDDKRARDSMIDYRRQPINPSCTLPIIPETVDRPMLQRVLDGYSPSAQLFLLRSIAAGLNSVHDPYCQTHVRIDVTAGTRLEKQDISALTEILLTLQSAYRSPASSISSATPLRLLVQHKPLYSLTSHGQAVTQRLTDAFHQMLSESKLDYERKFYMSLIWAVRDYTYGDKFINAHNKALCRIRAMWPSDTSNDDALHAINDETTAQLVLAIDRHVYLLNAVKVFLLRADSAPIQSK